MRLYRVKYTFTAEEEGELSVHKGDLVRVPGDGDGDDGAGRGDWTLVETLTPPFGKGYVPSNYIVKADNAEATLERSANAQAPLTSPAAGSYFGSSRPVTGSSSANAPIDSGRFSRMTSHTTSASTQQSEERSPTHVSQVGSIRRLSDPRLPQHLLETLESSDVHHQDQDRQWSFPMQQQDQLPRQRQQYTSHFTPTFSDSRGPSSPSHIDLNRLFATHDKWLDNALQEREREFNEFDESIDIAAKVMANVHEKHQGIMGRLKSLEAQVESHRQKLKQKIAEESQSRNNRVQQLYA